MRALANARPTAAQSARRPPLAQRAHAALLSATPAGRSIQRRCACGGGCPACEDRRLIQTKLVVGDPHDRFEQEADRVARQVAGAGPTPMGVSRVQRMTESGLDLVQDDEASIRTKPGGDRRAGDSGLTAAQADSITTPASGMPLPTPARAVMEQRLGFDFGGVRIHTGAEAADLNRRLHAQAFTYGRDIWFGAGASPADLHLLAHELTHVVQQRGVARRLIQRQPATLTPAQLGSITAVPLANGGVLPEEFVALWLIPNQCDPYRALTRGDFVEDSTLPGGMAGRTDADIVAITVHGVAGFGAKLNSTSALLPSHKHPADRAKTPCGGLVTACRNSLNAGSPGFSISNASGCAAAPRPTGRATSVAECDSVVGAACDAAVAADADRVLAHEQLHMDIACVIAAKANLAFWRAGLPARIDIAAIERVKHRENRRYDRDTVHGCDAAQQLTWENRVRQQFLPGVTF